MVLKARPKIWLTEWIILHVFFFFSIIYLPTVSYSLNLSFSRRLSSRICTLYALNLLERYSNSTSGVTIDLLELKKLSARMGRIFLFYIMQYFHFMSRREFSLDKWCDHRIIRFNDFTCMKRIFTRERVARKQCVYRYESLSSVNSDSAVSQ